MNRFEKQISQAAQTLREKHNATLKVPTPPQITGGKRNTPLKWWLSTAAAACIGYALGNMAPFHSAPTSPSLAITTETTVVRDTIFTTLRDTLFQDRKVPVYIPVANEQSLASAVMEKDSLISTSDATKSWFHENASSDNPSAGKNILDDTIHYALLVSM